ncbi:MAG TPA: uridine kinase [bacterium]|nr:uridine kinase [bacterium]HPN42490.1 uridine kinase [bacterium]
MIETRYNNLLIGIAGASGAGKSYYAAKFLAGLNSAATALCIDSYYKKQTHLPMAERVKQNYDHPAALDFALLHSHLQNLQNGIAIARPVYDYSIHDRTAQTEIVNPAPFIFIEGVLLFAYPPLLDLFDYKIYIDTPPDICFIRRLQRDTKERGRTVESVIEQYMNSVRPMLNNHVFPYKNKADVIVNGENFDQAAFTTILEQISTLR